MVIDFHTHIFPDKIAETTINHLQKAGGVKASTDGTLQGLRASMSNAGVDISVILPVLTRPEQFLSVNQFAAKINGTKGIVSFGGIHPDTIDYQGELDQIKALGLPGIKLHPDYQNTFIDDEKYIRIIRHAINLDLAIVLHAGVDIGLPEIVHCTPQRSLRMLDIIEDINIGQPKVILAHTGGFGSWDQVEELLVGRNVMFDLSFSFGYIEDTQMKRIIHNHGLDKILFATDSPWGGQKETLEQFRRLNLDKNVEERILYKNAAELLSKNLLIPL